uniref:Replication factor A C-terminal domain-containing protein n=1 Tax=Catharus ustulatus TaxID=91951 RepID=A0A8C3THY8_CATUS
MNSVQGLLAASVISIQNSCFVYPACQNCFSRLVLDSRRFSCLKCGCTGEAKDASYRYRLSLKIADTNDLFDITVFGSCLDPFFGVTLSGETNTESSTRALVQAVETCFIGKRFIFGVKVTFNGGHSAASSVLQKCSRINRSTRNLVACQIFLPNAALTGFTVISYLDRLLQSAKFRSCNNSSYLPDVSSAPIDEPLSELSSLSSLSRSSCFVQSSGRESFLGCWQQSFSLTSSVAWVTAEDFPTVEVGKLVSEQHEQEERPVSAELGSKDNESSSQLNRTDSISAADKLESIGSSNTECPHGNSSKLLQHPLESEVKNNYLKTNSRNYCYPEKSHNSLVCKRDASAPNHVNAAGVSRVDSMLWEELPFSESLNELLVRIEDGRSVVTSPSLDAGKHVHLENGKLGVILNKSYSRQSVGGLPAASVSGRLLPPAENDSWENAVFACLQSNTNPLSDVSQCESSPSDLSSTLKEGGTSSPVTPEPSVSQSRCVQSKEANSDPANSSWSFIRLHGETSCVKKSNTWVHSASGSFLAACENKENCSTPSQKTDLTLTGPQVFDPPTPNNARWIHKRELKPLTELSENTFKSVSRKEIQWNNIFPEGSYNASADLFDASDDTLTEKITAESILSPGGVPCNSSKLDSSLHRSPHAFSKHSTPVISSFCDSECSSVCAQDFVPYSQSTPMTKPLQKLWPVGERSSFITIFTPKNPTKIHSKCKRSRSSFQNTLLQQLTSKFVKRGRPRNRENKASGSSASQQFLNSQLPASLEEWIPPSSNKGLKPTASFNLETASRAADLQSTCGPIGRNPISESRKNKILDLLHLSL